MKPGVVHLLVDFRDPIIVGTFVFRCHILEHEDYGMMAEIQVVSPTPAMPNTRSDQPSNETARVVFRWPADSTDDSGAPAATAAVAGLTNKPQSAGAVQRQETFWRRHRA